MRTSPRPRPAPRFRHSPLIAAIACALGAQGAFGATFTVGNANDSGAGSLRQAITDANLACGSAPHTINFSGPFTISPGTELPRLACQIEVNAGGQAVVISGAVAVGGFCGLGSSSGLGRFVGMTVRDFRMYGGSGFCGVMRADGNTSQNNVKGFWLGDASILSNNQINGNDYGVWNDLNGSTFQNNTFAGNSYGGILNAGNHTITGNTISGTSIGYAIDVYANNTITGNTVINNQDGIYAESGSTIENNTVRGNGFDGIYLYDGGIIRGNTVYDNQYNIYAAGGTVYGGPLTIENNNVGTPDGVQGGTQQYGIEVFGQAASFLISGNLVVGHLYEGINVGDNAGAGTIQNNIVGLNAAGTAALPNNIGIAIRFSYGGALAVSNNTVSGNSSAGIEIFNSKGVTLTANKVGTNSAGTAAFGNGLGGLAIGCSQNLTVTGNLVSANGTYGGVFIDGLINSDFLGNKIGTDISGNAPLANNGPGVSLNSNDCYFAPPPPPPLGSSTDLGPKVAKVTSPPANNFFYNNTIAHNNGDGFRVVAGKGNDIVESRIHSNAGKNINLNFDGAPLANNPDPSDGSGISPNNGQNYPENLTAVGDSGNTVLSFTLNSIPAGGLLWDGITPFNGQFDIHVYANQTAGVRAGQTYVENFPVTVDASGNFSGSRTITGTFQNITLTATGPYGTSEFSAPVAPLVPAATIVPSTVSFGNVIVGNTSPAQEVTFTSTGNGPYMIDSIRSVASPPSCPGSGVSICTSGDFSCSTTCAPATPYATQLPQAPACKLTGITFHPLVTGPQNHTIYVCDNTSAAPRAITFTGNGVAMTVNVSPSSHNFGAVPFGGTLVQQFTVTNPTGNPAATLGAPTTGAPFTVQSHTCTSPLAGGSSCTVNVGYSPGATTAQSGTLAMTVTNGNPISVPLQGNGQVTYSISPTSFDFGSQAVGMPSAPKSFTLSNTASNDIPLGAVSATAPFSVSGTTCTGNKIPAAGSCTVSALFTPTANGVVNGQLNVPVGATGAPAMNAALQGNGGQSGVILPASASLGTGVVGGPDLTASVTLQNNGTVALAIASIFASTPFQSAHTCPASLAPGASCPIQLKLTPTTAGNFTGTLTVTSNSPSSPNTVALSATVNSAQGVLVLPTGIDFGTAALASNVMQQSLLIKNTGNGNVDFTSIGVSSPFQLSHNCPGTLAPQAQCTANLGFDPVIYGNTTGQLSINSNAQGGNRAITLLATVDRVTYGVSPGGADYGSVPVGQASPQRNFIISNNGDRAIPISGVSTTGPFAIARTDCGALIAPRSSCSADVTFNPVQGGIATGSLVARVGLQGAPAASSALTGTGTQQAGLALPNEIDFGSVALGSVATLTQTLELRNTGNAVLTFQASITSGPFTLASNCGLNLGPGEACTLVLTFSPAEVGEFIGSLAVVSNAPGGSRSVRLIARVQPRPVPVISFTPTVVGFGDRVIGTPSAAQRVTVSNIGAVEATLGPLQAGPDFVVSSQCGATLAPQASCVADITFRPIGFGPRPGSLTFSSNATGSPHRIDLLGRGCRPFGLVRRPGQDPCSP